MPFRRTTIPNFITGSSPKETPLFKMANLEIGVLISKVDDGACSSKEANGLPIEHYYISIEACWPDNTPLLRRMLFRANLPGFIDSKNYFMILANLSVEPLVLIIAHSRVLSRRSSNRFSAQPWKGFSNCCFRHDYPRLRYQWPRCYHQIWRESDY